MQDLQIMAKEKYQKYIISLDAVDVGLLPINYQSKFDNITPLWTTNNLNMRNNEYYEFEIKNVDTKMDDDPEDEILNIPCHICNIDVPVPYLKQHHDSFKHIINMKIADTAVERIKKSVHQHNFCNNETYPSLYFCPACVAAVKLKDRTKHEKSIAHKNSLIVNKILNDFYILYTDTNCEDYDVHLDKNNLNQFNDLDVKKVTNNNVDHSIDSVGSRSATDSGSKLKECDNDIPDRNKVNDSNSRRSDNVKTIINNHEEITSENPINVSSSVEDNKHETIEDKTLEDASKSSKVTKKDTKKKKAKTKNNAGTSQDLVSEGEKNQITSPISLSSVEGVITGEVSKNVPDVIKTEKVKTKKSKMKNNNEIVEDIVQNSNEQDNNGMNDFLSFFGDDIKVEDIFKKTPEVVKKENSKTKKAKTKKDTNEKNRSSNSLSFSVDDKTFEEASGKPAEVIKKEKKKGSMKNETKENNKLKDMNRENENQSCQICNNDDNKDHSVCIFLWNELCERFNEENEINFVDFLINDILPFDIYYHLIMKCKTPYCMVCKVNFYGDVDIITHLLSKEHLNSYKALMSEHFLISDNNITTCKVCDVKFKKEYELIHCEDIKHITRQEKYKRQLSKMNSL